MAASESTKYMDVSGKVALVTGGAAGIGRGMVNELLAAGLKKAYIGDVADKVGEKTAQELNSEYGDGKCSYIHLDVTSQEQFEDAFKKIISEEECLDILINNAGIIREKYWELEIDINLKGAMRGCMLALKYMPTQKRRGGCVVNTASIGSFEPGYLIPGYIATKHGVAGLTRSFANPLIVEETGVRMVAVAPGTTRSNICDDSAANHFNEEWGKKFSQMIDSIPYQQSPDSVGRGTVHIIQYGAPGDIWVVEDDQLFSVNIPDRKSLQKKIKDL